MKTILLVCGGNSHEHEISLRSAKNIYSMIVDAGYTLVLVGISKTNRRYAIESGDLELEEITDGKGSEVLILPGKHEIEIEGKRIVIDVLFPINHGQTGEDGVIQGVATMLGVPCVGPGLLSSVQCFHKHLTKNILEKNFIDCAPGTILYSAQEIPAYDTLTQELGPVLFVKPSAAGSSVGVSKVTTTEEYTKALEVAFEVDDVVLVESAVQGREIEFAVVGSGEDIVISVPGEIKSNDWYSYEEKYTGSSTTQCVVADDLEEEVVQYCKDIVSKVYATLGCTGLARVDGFLTIEGKFIINEVNTLPGFTDSSMYPILMKASGVDSNELMKRLIDSAE